MPRVPVLSAAASLGVLARTVWIRFLATLKHLPEGFRQLPRNWRETIWVIDAGSAPILIPRAERVDPRFSEGWWWSSAKKETSLYAKIFAVFVALVWGSSRFYRWSIKATVWLWWPLVLVLMPPFYFESEEEIRIRMTEAFNAKWPDKLVPYVMAIFLSGTAFFAPDLATLSGKFAGQNGNLIQVALEHVSTWSSFFGKVGADIQFLAALFVLASLLMWRLTGQARAYEKSLSSPDEFRKLRDASDKLPWNSFLRISKNLERLRAARVASIIFLGYAVELHLVRQFHPEWIGNMFFL